MCPVRVVPVRSCMTVTDLAAAFRVDSDPVLSLVYFGPYSPLRCRSHGPGEDVGTSVMHTRRHAQES